MDAVKNLTALCKSRILLLRWNFTLLTPNVALLKFMVCVLDFQIRIYRPTHKNSWIWSVVPSKQLPFEPIMFGQKTNYFIQSQISLCQAKVCFLKICLIMKAFLIPLQLQFYLLSDFLLEIYGEEVARNTQTTIKKRPKIIRLFTLSYKRQGKAGNYVSKSSVSFVSRCEVFEKCNRGVKISVIEICWIICLIIFIVNGKLINSGITKKCYCCWLQQVVNSGTQNCTNNFRI